MENLDKQKNKIERLLYVIGALKITQEFSEIQSKEPQQRRGTAGVEEDGGILWVWLQITIIK